MFRMKLMNIVSTSLFQIVSLLLLFGYLLGVMNIYFSDKNNFCEMTYMFEYPQFVHISLEENQKYPQYGLFAYSEGRFTEKARKMWFDGIPVLFLPGNSGSYMQARSLASVALRKALTKGYDYHFDYFTINFNEEYSGLYGGVLQSQTDFAAACITKILSLYKNHKYTQSVPTSVILIGHSMGGLVAKRLMAYPTTLNTTRVVITLAAPLEAPVINFDNKINDYYLLMGLEWKYFVNKNKRIKARKILISIGSGPRDVLLPAGLTSSDDSYINALATAIPGVWASPDHVSMVWCKQLVLVINRYLFDIVDPKTNQITKVRGNITAKAKQYFQANRSMTLSPKVKREEVLMIADAFWYEDNRRIYQISRPSIDRPTYLMIRLVNFPQNRFVAIEAVNLDDKDWIFGCNAMYTLATYRYCKEATSITELSRWSGAAKGFGKRKLATILLHNLISQHRDWTHVIVKVSPTKKPIVLNVDINDHASRFIRVRLPWDTSLTKRVIIEQTAPNSLYYELVIPGLEAVHQAYLLYVEPTEGCQASEYHVTAEMHVPWTNNHEQFHYYTHLKRSPMKLRLFKSNPNITLGLEPKQYVKVTLLLDPQCTYKVSISPSWYHRLGQLARNYSPTLVPYAAAIVLLVTRTNLLSLQETGTCMSIHSALMNDGVKPYYAIVFGRFGTVAMMTMPVLMFFFENANLNNLELQYFTKSMLVLPAYMTALGILNVLAAVVLVVMVFSSQLASRLLFRIVWRGGSGLSEKVASGLQKVPLVVSAALVCAVPLSCGAASMAAGAAFYAFMISKMYEEYLEDYFYKFMAKIGSRVCRIFKSKNKIDKKEQESTLALQRQSSGDTQRSDKVSGKKSKKKRCKSSNKRRGSDPAKVLTTNKEDDQKLLDVNENDEKLSNLNFHMTMFFLWMTVTIVNIPTLLTWARNFKFNMILKSDTSFYSGLTMSFCSTFLWQQEGPRKNLRSYDSIATLLFAMAIFIVVLGPYTLAVVNYVVPFVFAIITMQQIWDEDDLDGPKQVPVEDMDDDNNEDSSDSDDSDDDKKFDKGQLNTKQSGSNNRRDDNCDVGNESRIYGMFKNLRDKFTFNNDG